MRVRQEKSVMRLFLRIPLRITGSIKNPRQEPFIDIVLNGFIFYKNPFTLYPCLSFGSKTGIVYLKQELDVTVKENL